MCPFFSVINNIKKAALFQTTDEQNSISNYRWTKLSFKLYRWTKLYFKLQMNKTLFQTTDEQSSISNYRWTKLSFKLQMNNEIVHQNHPHPGLISFLFGVSDGPISTHSTVRLPPFTLWGKNSRVSPSHVANAIDVIESNEAYIWYDTTPRKRAHQ